MGIVGVMNILFTAYQTVIKGTGKLIVVEEGRKGLTPKWGNLGFGTDQDPASLTIELLDDLHIRLPRVIFLSQHHLPIMDLDSRPMALISHDLVTSLNPSP